MLRLIYTIKYLKLKQILWQIFTRLKTVKYLQQRDSLSLSIHSFNFSKIFRNEYKALVSKNQFCFLNHCKCFEREIDWNYLEYGKLWTYNLEYFDYLHQSGITVDAKLRLINDFYSFSVKRKRRLEPYPVSLRAINLIRFTTSNDLNKQQFHDYLYHELKYLDKNYEYHILGNHLLENAFSLCLGGVFFSNEKWHNRAVGILRRELDEQILSDGAHFELSPMYHNIIFFRLLELIDWYSHYDARDEEFLSFCRQKASLMLNWLENIRFKNGDIPLFNDAAKDIAYESSFLIEYAEKLGVIRANCILGASGYRSFENNLYEIKIDLAQIGASYQPGHAHADALSFILYHNNKPLFVEQGTSTYQIGERRNLERSTQAHNTVVVNDRNQSEVWGGFRVGRRAKTTIHKETPNSYDASHDGYKKIGIIHSRTFLFKEKQIEVIDTLSKKGGAKFYLHIHPDRMLTQIDTQRFSIDNNIVVLMDGALSIEVEDYDYAETYNQYRSAKRLVVSFTDNLHTAFSFKD